MGREPFLVLGCTSAFFGVPFCFVPEGPMKVDMRPDALSTPALLKAISECTLCEDLPLGPKPLLQAHPNARILIAGQAPGRRTHDKGIPFDDPSGERLRDWMGISRDVFYDAEKIAILPMGFCYPGAGKSGDLPPRTECAPAWRRALLDRLPHIDLTLIIGRYAMEWHMDVDRKETLTQHVARWQEHLPATLPLPHPSPRNNRWLKRNPWFEQDVVPALKSRIGDILGT